VGDGPGEEGKQKKKKMAVAWKENSFDRDGVTSVTGTKSKRGGGRTWKGVIKGGPPKDYAVFLQGEGGVRPAKNSRRMGSRRAKRG